MEESGFKEKALNIWERTPALLRLVVLYAVLNGVIYGAQELYYYKDTQKMNQLEGEMGSIRSEISSLESRATDGGLAEPYYSRYKNDIDKYNSKADEYNTLSERSGSRWWLIPIPIGRGKTSLK